MKHKYLLTALICSFALQISVQEVSAQEETPHTAHAANQEFNISTKPAITDQEMKGFYLKTQREYALSELRQIRLQLYAQKTANFTALAIAVTSSAILLSGPLSRLQKGTFITGRTEKALNLTEAQIRKLFGANTLILKPAFLYSTSAVALPLSVRYYVMHATDTLGLVKALDLAERKLHAIERMAQVLSEDGVLPSDL